jgi:trimeric autotransporter adhesin
MKLVCFSHRLAGLLACLVGTLAQASVSPPPATWPTGNAVNGKPLFTSICLSCHTGVTNETDQYGVVGNGANRPALINGAILNGTMNNAALRALTAQQLSDIASYLGNPGASTGAPVITVSPTTLTFNQTSGTTSANQTVVVGNTGNAALAISNIAIAGAQANEFAVAATGTCTASVAAGANCTVQVNFKPTASGSRTATLVVSHNGAGSPSNVVLNGTASSSPQPVASVNQNALTFPAQALGSKAIQSVTITNLGLAALVLSSANVSGAHATDFVLGGTCTAGASILAGASCRLDVQFSPGAIGTRTASLAISSNASPLTISLSATATGAAAPALTLTPSAQDFSVATVRGPGVTRQITLTNSGTAVLVLNSLTVSGMGFTSIHNCPANLAVGGACNITMAFSPTVAGPAAGKLTVLSNATNSPQSATLSAAGVTAVVPRLEWTIAGALPAFAQTVVGNTSAALSLTLMNQGPGPATLGALTSTSAEFVLSGACTAGLVLAANTSCPASVVFAPAQVGPRAGVLSVASNGTNPARAQMAGSGVLVAQKALEVSEASVTLAPREAGSPVEPVEIRITNSGTADISVAQLQFAKGFFVADTVECGNLPVLLVPGQKCDIFVQPAAAYVDKVFELSDTLSIVSDAPSVAPKTVSLQASITAAPEQPTTVTTNQGAGGCSVLPTNTSLVDPTLWLLCLLAAGVLVARRRSAVKGQP